MVEPLSIIAALKGATDAGEMLSLLPGLLKGDELDRLLDHLDRVFGESTGLSSAQLQTWKQDKDFCAALLLISHTADWEDYREELKSAVVGLTAEHPEEARADELALAERVVGEIEYFLPFAKRGDDVTRYVGNEIQLSVERATSPLRERDWAPERGRDLFDELEKSSSHEASILQRALEGKDLSQEIPALLTSTPSWLDNGSGLMWEVLAASAEGVGLWEEAASAWDAAFDRPGSDRVRTRVRAASAAYIAGSPERSSEAIAEAEALGPNHPLVLFSKADRSEDPEETLALLDQVDPIMETHRALRDLRRAVPLAKLGRLEEAEESLARARDHALKEEMVSELAEIESRVVVARERPAWKAGEKTDVEGLLAAADCFLGIRDKHRDLGAYEGAVAYLCEAVGALLMAEERGRALSLMASERLLDEELNSSLNRNLIGEQLLQAGRSDLAAKMLPELDPADEISALIHAIATVQGDNEDEEVTQAVAVLDAAVTGERQLAAAQARLIASLRHKVAWSESAAAILEGNDPGLAAVFKAKWLQDQERYEEAEEVLLPHFTEPRAQHALLLIAQAREEPDRIANRAHEILAQPSDQVVRLEATRALITIDQISEAEAELHVLASAETAPQDIRSDAYAELAELLTREERYLDLLELAEQWLQFPSAPSSARWGRLHCLFRLGRFDEALQLLDGEALKPVTSGQAQLAARICALALEGVDAVRRIVAIADALEHPDEAVEALALFSRLDITEEMPSDLLNRVNPERFLEAFPESTLIQRIDAPKSVEELVDLLEELGGDRQERIAQAAHSVFDEPLAPAALISIAAGQTVSAIWRGLQRRPTGFGLAVLLEDERAFASNALALGAVWDPSSLVLVEEIGGRLAEVTRRLLPKSVITQSTLDDILADSAGMGSKSERGTLSLDETRRPTLIERSEEEVLKEESLIKQVQSLAQGFVVEPDVMARDSGGAAESVRHFEDPAPQLLTFLGSLATAERRALAVFSADRYVRLTARRMGLRAFGVEALVDALADRGEITTEERLGFRRRLRELSAMGTRASTEELAAEVHAEDYRLTASLAYALQDPAPLQADMGDWHLTLLGFLRAIHEEKPAALDIWTARVIAALEQNLNLTPSQIGGRLLALSFKPGSEENRFAAELATAVVAAVSRLGDRGDPVLAGARLLYRATVDALDWMTQGVLLARFANLMPPGHSLKARLVIFEDPREAPTLRG